MMLQIIGFLIALAVGLTGIGGGSFTVPALILLAALPAPAAVGSAFVFAGVLRLIAAPFYLYGRQVHGRYLWVLLKGAIPGLLIGTYLLRWMSNSSRTPLVVIALGLLLAGSSAISFARRLQNPSFARKNARWLPWLAVPIGIESGFSSAGAGALGTVLLLNYSEMTPAEVVGTDLLFGLVLAVLGAAFHWSFGSIRADALMPLLAGGIPGVLAGCLLARRVPAQRLKAAVTVIALFAGLQLVWSGAKSFAGNRASLRVPAFSRTVEASPGSFLH
jgi:uncharacterized membrane protein YfcA